MIKKPGPDEGAWIDRELANDGFQDVRLRRRFRTLLERLWMGVGQTIPFACQDWANTKGAYRFLSNERVSEQDILSGHFQASAERFRATEGPVLVLQDTTTFSYQRERPGTRWLYGQDDNQAGKAWPAAAADPMWHFDAFEPGRDRRRFAARTDRH